MILKYGLIHLTLMKMIKDKNKNKKVPGLFKDELGGRIVVEFVGIRPKTWAYLIDGYEDDDYETIR